MIKKLQLLISLSVILNFSVFSQTCDPTTPVYSVDLSSNPDSVWASPSVTRMGLCCDIDPAVLPQPRCVQFDITLHPLATGVNFDILTGAIAPGALYYTIDCNQVYGVNETANLNPGQTYNLRFCHPGTNPNSYSITSISSTITNTRPESTNLISTVSPNPATDFIRMEAIGNDKVYYEIQDLQGKKLLQGDFSGIEEVNIVNLKKGIYLIKFSAANGYLLQTHKIIKD